MSWIWFVGGILVGCMLFYYFPKEMQSVFNALLGAKKQKKQPVQQPQQEQKEQTEAV